MGHLKYTYNEVKQLIEEYNCKLLSKEYINNKSNLQLKCFCGNDFETTLDRFISSKFHCCRKCAIKNRKHPVKISYKELFNYIQSYNCKLITKETEFKDVHSYVDIECSCGNIFNVQAFAFRASKTKICPKCSKIEQSNKSRYSDKEIIEMIENINKENNTTYIWIGGKYKDVKSNLELIDKDGYKYRTILHNLYRMPTLYKFCEKNPYTIENIKNWLSINIIGYQLISDNYNSMKEKLKFKCLNGHIFDMQFSNMQNGQRCPECDLSNGEKRVLNWILLNKLYYTFQFSFDNCRGKRKPLLFDFAIFEDKEKTTLKYIIEYDGELHYQVGRYSKDKDKMLNKLKTQQKYDQIKDDYCKNNKIKLIRIPYWNFESIEEILNREL